MYDTQMVRNFALAALESACDIQQDMAREPGEEVAGGMDVTESIRDMATCYAETELQEMVSEVMKMIMEMDFTVKTSTKFNLRLKK